MQKDSLRQQENQIEKIKIPTLDRFDVLFVFLILSKDFQHFGSEKRSLSRAAKSCFCSENWKYLHEKLYSKVVGRVGRSDMVLDLGKGVSFPKPQLPHIYNVKSSTYLIGLRENGMSGYTQ